MFLNRMSPDKSIHVAGSTNINLQTLLTLYLQKLIGIILLTKYEHF